MRLKTIAAGAAAACAVAVPAVALATPAPRPHPAYTDAAGDARPAGLLSRNVPAADILAADVTTDGTTLTFSTRVAGARRLFGPVDTYYASFRPVGSSTEFTSVSRDDSATSTIYFESPQEIGELVYGTTSIDAATHTITATYSLAEVNAANQRATPGASLLTVDTPVRGGTAADSGPEGPDGVHLDSAATPVGAPAFTLGG